mgnify:CR=1 FL=1
MNSKNIKILVLVLCSRNYLSFISSKSQKKIWTKYISDFEILHYVGQSNPSNREVDYIKNSQDYLILNTDDSYSNIAKKTLVAFEKAIAEYDFDYIFRTNTSSYLDFKKFKKYADTNLDHLNYAGVNLKVQEGDKIASGAGIFLSKKNVEILIKNKKNFDTSLPDDVAISRLLKEFKIFPSDIPRIDLKSIPHPKLIFNSKDFHYRCRLDPQYHRILEPSLFRYLDKASQKISMAIFVRFFYLRSLFCLSNIKIIKKLIQKYYSYKFYGEINLGEKIIFKNKKI